MDRGLLVTICACVVVSSASTTVKGQGIISDVENLE
jgi:hypothetical protein